MKTERILKSRPGPDALVEGEKTYRVVGCLNESLLRDLETFRRARGLDRSSAIREAIELWVNAMENETPKK